LSSHKSIKLKVLERGLKQSHTTVVSTSKHHTSELTHPIVTHLNT